MPDEEGLITDERAMDLIAEMMSGNEWDADLTSNIADVVRLTGREVRDLYDFGEPVVVDVELP